MIRVAIETSTRVGSVAVGRDDDVLAEIELGEQTRHASRALPALDEALRSAGVRRSEIGAVVVGAGPGSFTGVRVAGATAKGLVSSLDVPLLAYSSLLALVAESATGTDPDAGAGPVCGLFDARRSEVYAGCWVVTAGKLEEVLAPTVGAVADTVEQLAAGVGARGPGEGAVHFAGDGAARYRAELVAACDAVGLAATVDETTLRPRGSALLWLAHHHGPAGRVEHADAWEPLYVRGSSAERGIRG